MRLIVQADLGFVAFGREDHKVTQSDALAT